MFFAFPFLPPCSSQLVVQILIFVMFFLLLCGTYLFRVGLIGVLSKYFKGVFAVTLVYLALTAANGGLRIAYLSTAGAYHKVWQAEGFTVMSVVQKLFAAIYYVVNIRTAIRLGDPKFYTKEPWVLMYREGNRGS